MPRYFFDITNDVQRAEGRSTVDDESIEYPDAHTARDVAITTLADVARDEIGRGQSREVAILMRDAENRALFAASLALKAGWLVDSL